MLTYGDLPEKDRTRREVDTGSEIIAAYGAPMWQLGRFYPSETPTTPSPSTTCL